MSQPRSTQFHLLSFEGPDPYSQAGGIASRISGLSEGLANMGLETHLWFIGDPNLPGHEISGQRWLHRWCQWISAHHPGGVYDGEEGKRLDYAASLPPFLVREVLLPHLEKGGRAVVLAEEWQTVDAVLHLDWLLRRRRMRSQVTLFWNANNTFGFNRIDWDRLAQAAVITTVSRYMRHLMLGLGVNPLVIPNGLSPEAFQEPERRAVGELRRRFQDRLVLGKVARWDPDKRWLLAVDIIAEFKNRGWHPLLIARGGVEAHGAEVMAAAAAAGLHVLERDAPEPGARGLLRALEELNGADVVSLRSHLDPGGRRVLFRGASAVLANSGHEPFGLVGLETMAVGGIACTGCSGEDYAIPGRNALVMQTDDPREFVGLFRRLHANPAEELALRRAGQRTAKQYAWPQIIQRILLPRVHLAHAPSPLAWAHPLRGVAPAVQSSA